MPALLSRTICALLPLLAACQTPSPATSPDTAEAQLEAAWVQIVPEGQAELRALTRAPVCPEARFDDTPVRWMLRAAPEDVPQRPTASPATDSKPSRFEVRACTAPLPDGVQRIQIGSRLLPRPAPIVRRILVIGDTGCRLKINDHYFQACNDPEKWAFPEVARSAARLHPDLVLHVGDYHYRENACPEGDARCSGSPWGYGWDSWRADFFAPAAPLLAAAPWVMVRGNHESCARAGQGWWRFLDAHPLTPTRTCDHPEFDGEGDYSPPYAVPLGAADASAPRTQLLIFDSSRVPHRALREDEPARAVYRSQIEILDQLAAHAEHNILVDHHPVLGLSPNFNPQTPDALLGGNAALHDLLIARYGPARFPASVTLLLAGHVHLFQAHTFASHPAQIVSGNGGSSLDQPLPFRPGSTAQPGLPVQSYLDSNRPGFALLERRASGWEITAYDRHGQPYARCQQAQGQTHCAPLTEARAPLGSAASSPPLSH